MAVGPSRDRSYTRPRVDGETGFTDMAYDNSNIFARILRGEIPSHKVYEDQHTLAFMDVMPQADGHTLVIPKAPAENILDVPPEVLAATILTTQRVAKAVKKAFAAPGILVAQLNGSAAGQSVFHLHFHVVPRHTGLDLRFHARDMADQALLAEHAARVRAALD
jgi:histidine triad (HIT) family protein